MQFRQIIHRSLNAQLLTILAIISVGMMLLAGMVLQFVLWPAFVELERDEARSNSLRVTEALSNELAHLSKAAVDWAVWDDTYDFVTGVSSSYVDENLYYDAYVNVGHNLFAFYDASGKLIYALGFDLESGAELAFPDFSRDLTPSDPLIAFTAAGEPAAGLVATEHGLMWVATHPILRSSGDGAHGGYLIAGRLITPALVEALREQTHLSFSLWAEPGGVEAPGFDTLVQRDDSNPDVIATVAALPTITGSHRVAVLTETPRTITAIGLRTLAVAAATTVVVGTLLLLALAWLLRHTIVQPLRAVSDHVQSVGRAGRLPAPCPVRRDDEIGMLARQFDAAFEQLAEVRHRLLDQSYYTGMAEMSAGILHNVRNAMSPATIALGRLIQSTHGMSPAQLSRAIAELRDPAVPSERQQKLLKFVDLSVQQLNADRERSAHDLQDVMQQLFQTEKILDSHAMMSRRGHSRDRIELSEVLSEARQFAGARSSIAISIAGDMEASVAPAIVADRVVLGQIINNVLLNAIEAIEAAGVADGRILITVARETGRDGFLRLTFTDNGCGMDQATIARLFERGFSTKRGTTGGIGLHWCANSATAMSGSISAESPGRAGEPAYIWSCPPRARRRSTLHDAVVRSQIPDTCCR